MTNIIMCTHDLDTGGHAFRSQSTNKSIWLVFYAGFLGISTKSYVFYVSAHLVHKVAPFLPRVVCTRAEFHNFDSESK